MEMKFRKPRGFFSEWAEEKKPLPYFAQVPLVGIIEAIFQPQFSDFRFFCFSLDFAGDVSASW
jgi:hypothetical protein